MSWVAVSIVGATVVGGLIAGEASRGAANTQADSANRATDSQTAMFNQQREDLRPWRETGARALGNMENSDFQRDFSASDFQTDPGYQFRLAEGQKAIERSSAARGSLNSGSTLKALTKYGQDVASSEYQNAYNRFNSDRDRRFNRLASLAGVGQTANGQLGAAGQNYATNVSNNIMSAGNAQAAGQVAQANSINQGIGTGMNTWMQYQMMNRYAPTATTGA